MAKILRKSEKNHKAQVQENPKKITVHLLYMPEIDIGSFLQTLLQRSRLMVAQQIQSRLFQPVFSSRSEENLKKISVSHS